MKNLILILIIVLMAGSCKQETKNSTAEIKSKISEPKKNAETHSDLLSYNSSTNFQKEFKVNGNQAVVCISATLGQIEKIKKSYENEDDFYTVADDANYYFYTANQYLEQKKITCEKTESGCSIYLVAENERITVPKEMENALYLYFIYEKGKYRQFVYPIDIGENWIYENGHWKKKNNQ